MKTLLAAALAILAAAPAFAQSTPPKLEFEVASIRAVQLDNPNQIAAGLRMDGSQAHFGAVTIKNLVSRAYDVQAGLITGPDWITTQRFDIDAKLPEGSTTDQIPQMLQSLLAERFGLKIHHDSKEMPAYALILGKPPLNLKEAPADSTPPAPNSAVSANVAASAAGVSMNLEGGGSYTFANNQFQFHKVTMDVLALQLARYMDSPVVNLTALKGTYDLTLNVTQEDYYILLVRLGANNGAILPPQAMPLLNGTPASLFDSIEQQGLRLDKRKLPLDTITVDQINQTPSDN
jgi:uncharacterized protein (TIGR03435 family)